MTRLLSTASLFFGWFLRVGRCKDLKASKAPPSNLSVGGVYGVHEVHGHFEGKPSVLWLCGPQLGSEEVQLLQEKFTQLNQLKRIESFKGAIQSSGQVGLCFGSHAEAEAYMVKKKTLSPTLPTWQAPKTFTLSFQKETCGAYDVCAAQPPPRAFGLCSHLHCLAKERAKHKLPSNVLRIWRPCGAFVDVEVLPSIDMQKIYETLRKESPGSILARLPEGQEAVLPSDAMFAGEALQIPPMSLPLALPTEFQAPASASGERDLDLALMKEILCEMLGEYTCVKRDSAESSVFTFKHRKEPGSRNKLIVVKSSMQYLDDVIQHRKVAFLSIVGKPREGKSTVLGLMKRLLEGRDGLPLFKCSNSSEKACTAGLWVSTQPLPTKSGSHCDESILLMLDTEGLFADEGISPDYFVRLFTMVGVLSSVMILNNKISNTVAEEFKAPLLRLAMMYRGFFEQNPWFREHRPRVFYLARDWDKEQDLLKDTDMWNEAEDRCTEDGPLSDAMNFIREAFGVVKPGCIFCEHFCFNLFWIKERGIL